MLVLDQSEEGWARVRKEDGSEAEGLVPVNYLSEWLAYRRTITIMTLPPSNLFPHPCSQHT